MTADTPIKSFYGVGEKRAEAFARLGVETAHDLLRLFPRAYQPRGYVKRLCDTVDGEVTSVLLSVAATPSNTTVKGRMTLTKFVAFDDTGRCTVTYFNQGYLKDVFRLGSTFRFYGKIRKKGARYEMSAPAHEAWFENRPLPDFFPIYPLRDPLTQKNIKDAINTALHGCPLEDEEIIPETIRERYSLLPIKEALYHIHQPNDYSSLKAARDRFVFEELFTFACAVCMTRESVRGGRAPIMERVDTKPFTDALPFTLTPAQKRCAKDILLDLTNEKGIPMARLLSGDVGSGKTVVAALAAYITCKSGYQCALMAPTEILANQHYKDLSELLGALGIKTALLTGSVRAAARKKILSELASGEIDMIIGTHALLTDTVVFGNLGLVITDEQHRFGVMQRAALAQKGGDVHTLVMSATPIPRTLAHIMYGDLDISIIDELPPGRQKVDTFIVNETYRMRLLEFMRKQVRDGGQVYVVCPSIESEEDEGLVGLDYHENAETKPKLKNAVEYCKELSEALPECRIEFLHGKQSGAQKDKTMSAFAEGKIDILVSTTVIEVGVNVPNASLMIVENAERFGLSQLHQLRGRVGRGERKSYFILVSDSETEVARERLCAIKENANGYKIAEIDLKMRGPGDFLPHGDKGAKQHGVFSFGIANLCDDMATLTDAFACAEEILRLDPGLMREEHRNLRAAARTLYGEEMNTVN